MYRLCYSRLQIIIELIFKIGKKEVRETNVCFPIRTLYIYNIFLLLYIVSPVKHQLKIKFTRIFEHNIGN